MVNFKLALLRALNAANFSAIIECKDIAQVRQDFLNVIFDHYRDSQGCVEMVRLLEETLEAFDDVNLFLKSPDDFMGEIMRVISAPYGPIALVYGEAYSAGELPGSQLYDAFENAFFETFGFAAGHNVDDQAARQEYVDLCKAQFTALQMHRKRYAVNDLVRTHVGFEKLKELHLPPVEYAQIHPEDTKRTAESGRQLFRSALGLI